jgi:hypothetical protein
MEEERIPCTFLMGKLEGLRSLGRKWRRATNNSKIDIREI